MKLRLAIFFSFIFSSYGCVAALTAESIIFQDIVITSSEYVSFPDIVKLESGKLLIIYRQGKNHAASDGKIWAIMSDLDGNFHSPPFVLYDDQAVDDRDPSIYQLKNGDIVLTFFKYFYAPVKSTQTFFVRFNNKLEKLSEKRVSNDALKMATSSNLIESSNLELILPTYGYAHDEKLFSVGFYQSENGGLDWSLYQRAIAGTLNHYWPQEPAIIELSSQRFLMMYRTSKESDGPAGLYPMYFTISTAGNPNHWEVPTPMDTIGHAPKLLKLKNGSILAIFRSLDNFAAHNLFRCEVAFKISHDEGKSWSKNQVLYRTQNDRNYGWDCGYPSIVELTEQNLLAVYYTFRGKSIQTARFQLSNSLFR